VAIAALAVFVVSILIAGGSLWYAHLANERAKRAERRAEAAEHRDAARFAGERTEAKLDELDRVDTVMRDLEAAREAAATEPQAPIRVKAAQSRLQETIAATGIELPTCAEYAKTVHPAFLPEAERELEQARANIRLGGSTDAPAR
jgi:hypothetical protein